METKGVAGGGGETKEHKTIILRQPTTPAPTSAERKAKDEVSEKKALDQTLGLTLLSSGKWIVDEYKDAPIYNVGRWLEEDDWLRRSFFGDFLKLRDSKVWIEASAAGLTHGYRNSEDLLKVRGGNNSMNSHKLMRLNHPHIPKLYMTQYGSGNEPLLTSDRGRVTPRKLASNGANDGRIHYVFEKPMSIRPFDGGNLTQVAQAIDVINFVHGQGFALGELNLFAVVPRTELKRGTGVEGKGDVKRSPVKSPQETLWLLPGAHTTRLHPGESRAFWNDPEKKSYTLVNFDADWTSLRNFLTTPEARALLDESLLSIKNSRVSYVYPPEYPLPETKRPDLLLPWQAALKWLGPDWGFTYLEMLMALYPEALGNLNSRVLGNSDGNFWFSELTKTFAQRIDELEYLRTPINFYAPNTQYVGQIWTWLTTDPSAFSAYQVTYNKEASNATVNAQTPRDPSSVLFVELLPSTVIAGVTGVPLSGEVKAIDVNSVGLRLLTEEDTKDRVGFSIFGIHFDREQFVRIFRGSPLVDLVERGYKITKEVIPVVDVEKTHVFLSGDVLPFDFYSSLSAIGRYVLLSPVNYLGLYHGTPPNKYGARHYLDMIYARGRNVDRQLSLGGGSDSDNLLRLLSDNEKKIVEGLKKSLVPGVTGLHVSPVRSPGAEVKGVGLGPTTFVPTLSLGSVSERKASVPPPLGLGVTDFGAPEVKTGIASGAPIGLGASSPTALTQQQLVSSIPSGSNSPRSGLSQNTVNILNTLSL